MKIYIDLETFSEIPLPTHGVYRYAEHASTRILLLAYAINNGPVTVVDIDNREIPGEDFYAATKDPEVLFVAHNSEFERLLMHYTGLWPGLPSIPHEQWIDTQLEAYYNGFPGSLEYACTAAGTPINKDPRGKRLVMKFSKPRRPSKSNPDTRWTKQNAPEDWQAFKEYCGTDVESMRSLHLRCHRIPAEEVEYSILTKKMNDRGICIDKPVVTNALSIINSLSTEMENKVMQITGGIKTSQRDKTLLWLEDYNCKLEDWSAATVDKALKNPELAYDVKEVLLTRSILSKTSTKKLQGMMATLRHDERVGGTLQHYGAYRTGRWAGRLIQVQNFPRGTLKPHEINEVIKYLQALDRLALQVAYENPLDAISSCLRAMMIAEEGKLLVIADYSAIEARVLAWLAHQLDGLLEFHEGEDTYIIMAGVIYKISPTKVTQDQRKVGKDTVLGCGYNMGWETFMNQINNRGGEQITEKLARLAVEAYRAKNDRIASFWPNIEKAAKKALNNPDTQVKISYLIFEFDSLSDTLMMHLPSGRALFYPEPGLEKKKTKWGETRLAITFGEQQNTKWGRSSTYGGKLTENAVQAIAGDLMRYGFREAVRNDFPPIFTVHDELVAEIPDDNSRFRCYEDASKEFSRVIATRPDWAKVGKSKPNKDGKVYYGIPLTAEGFTTKRYAKNPLLENWAETGFKTTPKNGPRH